MEDVLGASMIGRWVARLHVLGRSGCALVGLAMTMATLARDFGPPISVAANFVLPTLALGAVSLAWAFVGRFAPRAAAAGGATIAVCGALVVGDLRPTADASADDLTLKIVTLNVWGRNTREADVITFLQREKPDVVFLQELSPRHATLRAYLGEAFPSAAFCRGVSICPVAVYSTLPNTATPPTLSAPAAGLRVALPASLGGGETTLFSVHLGWPEPFGTQKRDWRLLRDVLASEASETAIVAGDFNATPWSPALRSFEAAPPTPLTRLTRALRTWPTAETGFTRARLRTPAPFLPIDHVFVGAGWRAASVRRGPAIGSDHYPVIVRLSRRSAALQATRIETILPGARGGSPLGSASTLSMPSTTSPQTVY